MLHFHGLGDFLLISNLYLCNDKLCDWLGLVQWTEDCWSHCTRMQLESPLISGQTTTWGTLVSPKTRCYGEVDRSHANSSQHQHCSRLMYFFYCCALSLIIWIFLYYFYCTKDAIFLFQIMIYQKCKTQFLNRAYDASYRYIFEIIFIPSHIEKQSSLNVLIIVCMPFVNPGMIFHVPKFWPAGNIFCLRYSFRMHICLCVTCSHMEMSCRCLIRHKVYQSVHL